MFFKARRSKYQNKILLYLLLTAIIPVLILGQYSYRTYVSEFTEKINLSNASSLNQMMNYVDNLMDGMKSNYIEIVEADEVKWLQTNNFSHKDHSYIVKANEKFNGPTYLSNYVEGYSYIDFANGWVLTNSGMYPFNGATNKTQIREIFQMDNQGKNVFWLNNTQQIEHHRIKKESKKPIDRHYVDAEYLSLVLKAPLLSNRQTSMLIVNLKRREFEGLVSTDLEDEIIVILDDKGAVLFSNNEEVSTYLTQHKKENGSIQDLDQIKVGEGDTYNVTMLDSPVSGWTYIACYNTDTVSKGAQNILYTMGLILLALCIGIIILSLLGAKNIYKPVLDILDHLGMDQKEDKLDADEFSYIDNRITSLVTSKSELEVLIGKQKGQLVELFVLRLIRGNLTKEKIKTNLEVLDINLKKYVTVISFVPVYKDNNPETEFIEEDVIRLSIIENMPPAIKEKLTLVPTNSDKVIILVTSHDDQETLDKKNETICNELYDYIHNDYGGTIKVGISKNFQLLTNFRMAYNESIEAMKNNGEEENEVNADKLGNVTFYSDIARNSNDALYELVLEEAVKKAVDECNEEEAYKVTDEFIGNLSCQGVVFNEQYVYLHRFLIAIILVGYDAGLPINDVFKNKTNNLFIKFNNLYNYKEIAQFYKSDIIAPIIDQLSEFRKSNSEVIFNKIVTLVHERQGDITLEECADLLDYHPSYIWKIMKSKLDISFNTYTANKKMEYAKQMLLETDLLIADIAKELNYSNAQNFIRFFSKNEGVTPGKYRRLNRY